MSADIARLREARPVDDLIRAIPSWELEREPSPEEWMVERCFSKGTVGMLSGDGKIGKSLLMQQLLTDAVMGRPWLGLTTVRGNALFFGCEDNHRQLHLRHKAILRHMNIEHADLENGLHLIDRVGAENILAQKEQYTTRLKPTGLASGLLRYCLQHGIVYVVIDTATQTFSGNGNDEGQVRDYLNILRRIAVAIEGVVIITKHPSLSGRSSGTGEGGTVAWTNGVRSRLYMRHEGQETVLSGMESNYGEKLGKIRLVWSRGVFIQDSPEPVRHWLDRED